MATQAIAVLRALWDFSPESASEVSLNEGQTLFLLEREDDKCVQRDVLSAVY